MEDRIPFRDPMMPRASARWLALGIFITSVLYVAAVPLPARGQEAPSDLASLATCLRSQRALDVLLIFDESQSLRKTDPYDQRIGAAIALLRTLARIGDGSNEVAGRTVEVGVAGFGETFTMVEAGGRLWNRLDTAGFKALEATIGAFAGRDDALDTDFFLAMQGAQRELARHAASMSRETPHCQALMLFTDGQYSIDSVASKPYAPGVDVRSPEGNRRAIEIGQHLLCDARGLVDRIRDDRVYVVSVALASGISTEALTFIESMAVGEGSGAPCGESAPTGAAFSASSSDALLRVFDEIGNGIDDGAKVPASMLAAGPCAEPSPGCLAEISFIVDASYARVHILTETAGANPGSDVLIQFLPPGGGEGLRITPSPDYETHFIGRTEVLHSWLTENALDVDLRLPELTASPEAWEGEWTIQLLGEGPATFGAQIFVFGRFSPTVARPAEFTQGESVELVVALQDAVGSPAPPGILPSASLAGELTDPSGLRVEVLEFERKADGTFSAQAALGGGFEPGPLEVRMALSARVGDVELVSAPVVQRVWLRPPRNYPNVVQEDAHLGRVEGKDGASPPVRTTVTIIGGSEPGCVWFTMGDVVRGPEGVEGVVLDVPTEAGAPTAACPGFQVEAGESKEIELALSPQGAGLGRLEVGVIAHLKVLRGASPERRLAIPYDMAMVILPNRGVLWALFLALFILGLAGPVAFQFALAAKGARFDSPLGLWAAELPVVVDAASVLREVGSKGETAPLELDVRNDLRQNRDWADERVRELEMAPITFRARMGRLPLAPPFGIAEDAGRRLAVTRSDREPSTEPRVSLQLANEWIFTAEPAEPAPEGSPFGAGLESQVPRLRGTVHLLLARARPQEIQEVLDDVSQALPPLVDTFIERQAEQLGTGDNIGVDEDRAFGPEWQAEDGGDTPPWM